MDNCRYCSEIPFDKLPSEEEDALPHQPSLDDLAASAQKCNICKLINREVQAILSDKRPSGIFTVSGVKDKNIQITTYNSPRLVEFEIKENNRNVKPLFPTGLPERPAKSGPLRPWLFGNWWIINGNDEDPKLLGMGVRIGYGPSPFEGNGKNWGKVLFRGTHLRLQTVYDWGLANTIPLRLRAANCRSARALEQVSKWMNRCNQAHSCINLTLPTLLPDRVLWIKDYNRGSIHLMETMRRPGRYIALSHCWGSAHTLTTTISTFRDRTRDIRLANLPNTYLEAVGIAARLGIDYLWIDSLCIVQDDSEDWAIHAGQMGQIYANAYLVIAASSSTGDDSGCCPSRELRKATRYLACENRSLGKDYWDIVPTFEKDTDGTAIMEAPESAVNVATWGTSTWLIVTEEWLPTSTKTQPRHFVIGSFGDLYDPLANEPLNQRGWTLQERLLAKRTLHFGTQQMFWECCDSLLSEDGCLFPKINADASITIGGQKRPINKSASSIYKLESDEYRFSRLALSSRRFVNISWPEIVTEYSRRNLTMKRDKLPALAGIASVFGDSPEWEDADYLAGLWSSTMREDLCWRVYTHIENIPFPSLHGNDPIEGEVLSGLSRPDGYRAPSWSWASLDASVAFHKPSPGPQLFNLAEAWTKKDVNNYFGEVSDGFIRLEATLLSVNHRQEKEDSASQAHGTPLDLHVGTLGTISGTGYFDFDVKLPCWGLVLDSRNVLLLNGPVNDHGDYTRIGLADLGRHGCDLLNEVTNLPKALVEII